MNHYLQKLIGTNVVFGVSDPWDFCEIHGDQTYSAIVKSALPKLLLLELQVPLQYKGSVFRYLVAAARHADKSLEDITASNAIPVNLTPAILPENKEANTGNLFNAAASWRSWGLIGGLRSK